MSSLDYAEKQKLEELFNMRSGYVLNLSDTRFTKLFSESGIDINAEKYQMGGVSKAKKLRVFWDKEDDFIVGKILEQLLLFIPDEQSSTLIYNKCKLIIDRLLKTRIDKKEKDKNISSVTYNITNNGQIGNIGDNNKDNFVQHKENDSILSKLLKFSKTLSNFILWLVK